MSAKVLCPICSKRVFDKKKTCIGEIEIKCPHCKKIVSIKLQ